MHTLISDIIISILQGSFGNTISPRSLGFIHLCKNIDFDKNRSDDNLFLYTVTELRLLLKYKTEMFFTKL